jgi:hypothetical protein
MLPAILCIGKVYGLHSLFLKSNSLYNSTFINVADQQANVHVRIAVRYHSLRNIAVEFGMATISVLRDTMGDIRRAPFLRDKVAGT